MPDEAQLGLGFPQGLGVLIAVGFAGFQGGQLLLDGGAQFHQLGAPRMPCASRVDDGVRQGKARFGRGGPATQRFRGFGPEGGGKVAVDCEARQEIRQGLAGISLGKGDDLP